MSNPIKKQKVLLTLAQTASNFSHNMFKHFQDILILSDIPQPKNGVIIGTHDGSFHCDEALAVSMLKTLPKFKDAQVLRTRNLALLAQCDIVVDVGAEYIPENHRYDHHQREFTGTFDGFNTKL